MDIENNGKTDEGPDKFCDSEDMFRIGDEDKTITYERRMNDAFNINLNRTFSIMENDAKGDPNTSDEEWRKIVEELEKCHYLEEEKKQEGTIRINETFEIMVLESSDNDEPNTGAKGNEITEKDNGKEEGISSVKDGYNINNKNGVEERIKNTSGGGLKIEAGYDIKSSNKPMKRTEKEKVRKPDKKMKRLKKLKRQKLSKNKRRNQKRKQVKNLRNNKRKVEQGKKTEEKLEKKGRITLKEEIIGGLKNMTGKNLIIPQRIRNLLSAGPKFVIPYKDHKIEDIVDMITDIRYNWETDTDMRKIRNFDRWKNLFIRDILVQEKGITYNMGDREILEDIILLEDFLKTNKDITITEADKGKFTIIILKKELRRLKDEFMKKAMNNGLYKMKIDLSKSGHKQPEHPINTNEARHEYFRERESIKDDLIKLEAEKRKDMLVRKQKSWAIKGIYKDRTPINIGKEQKFWDALSNSQSNIPRMKFTIKGHKNEIGVRNIAPKNRTVTHILGQILNELVIEATSKMFNGMRDTNIKDIRILAIQLREKSIHRNQEMLVADIREMYNEIDLEKLQKIINDNIDVEVYNRETIMDMIRVDLKGANLILHENLIFQQEKGIPMGGTSSSMYAQIFTDFYINRNWESLSKGGITVMYKYIDDLFVISERNRGEKLLRDLGKDMGLEIKTEKEINNKIDYLQLQVIRGNTGKIETKWIKKPYTSNRIIHFDSAQPLRTKLATTSNIINNTMTLTHNKYLYDNLQININQLHNNGYGYLFIRNVCKNITKKYRNNMKGMMEKEEINNKLVILNDCIYTIQMKIDSENRVKKNKREIIKEVLKEKSLGKNMKRKDQIYRYRRNNQGKVDDSRNFIRVTYNKATNQMLMNRINQINKYKKQKTVMKLARDKRMGAQIGEALKKTHTIK